MNQLDYLHAIILGVIQGLTEFLPVSSSGHLALGQILFDLRTDGSSLIAFDVALHVGTVVATVAVFGETVRRYVRRLRLEILPGYAGRRFASVVALLAAAASIPTMVIGLALRERIDELFHDVRLVGAALLVTGTMLFVAGRLPRLRRGWREIGYWRAVLIGLAQGVALVPGVSRSGATICTAMFVGVRRRWAAEFSFFIYIPAVVGAAALKFGELMVWPTAELMSVPWGPILVGTLTATAVGYVALRILLGAVRRAALHHFCYYCWAIGLLALIFA